MPAPYFLLTAFIANGIGRVSGGTIKSWISGLKAWHDINSAPWQGEKCWAEVARCTANKEGTAFKREQHGLVTLQHFFALRSQLHLQAPFDAAIWAIACTTFWGCRHLGETTVPSLADFNSKFHITRGEAPKHITTPDSGRAYNLGHGQYTSRLWPQFPHRRLPPNSYSPVFPNIVAALGSWTSLAFLLYWRKIEHIVPMHVGKAYDKAKLNNIVKAFEVFCVAHNIIMPSIKDLRLLDED
ncbi:hypothetical protein B0H14DRAFT_3453373 [Mycena olivaceomarginata]|nr:hypothetical protein B0H14DRAFT_3453373 [Mycena olivaceomarginata]